MNTTLFAGPAPGRAPDRTFARALVLALVLEGGLGWLMLRPRPPAPVPPAPVRLKVAHIVQIADGPQVPAPPKPHESPPRPSPAKPTAAPAPRQPAPPATPAPAPAPAPAPTPAPTAQTPPQSQPTPPAAPPSRIKPGVRHGVVPLTRVEPDYPPRALANNIEGSVVADLTIEADGTVSDVRIVNAQPPGVFERAAEKALRQWKFSANDGGIVGEVELTFNLNN